MCCHHCEMNDALHRPSLAACDRRTSKFTALFLPPETQWERKERIPSQRGEIVFTAPGRLWHMCIREKGGFFHQQWGLKNRALDLRAAGSVDQQLLVGQAAVKVQQFILLQTIPGRGHRAGRLSTREVIGEAKVRGSPQTSTLGQWLAALLTKDS